MSVRVVSQIWQFSRARQVDLLVLLALGDFANDDGICWPGVTRLAEKCRVSVRTAQRSIRELERIGEVLVDRGAGATAKGGTTSRYRIVTPCQADAPSDRHPVTPETKPGDTGDADPVTNEAQPGDKGVTQTVIEPPRKPSREPLEGSPTFALEDEIAEVRGKQSSRRPASQQECEEFCRSLHLPTSDGEWFWNQKEGNGWRSGTNPIVNWKATIRAWKAAGYMASQKGIPQKAKTMPLRPNERPPIYRP